MNGEKFDKIVKARADQRAQAKIRIFKEEFAVAFKRLTGTSWYSSADYNASPFAKTILAVMASNNHSKAWPRLLWEQEEKAVEKELLSIMDEMQKALLAATQDIPQENTQAEA